MSDTTQFTQESRLKYTLPLPFPGNTVQQVISRSPAQCYYTKYFGKSKIKSEGLLKDFPISLI